ncbi:arsinothricin resistance N-acetyltransferase ArsN1 family B [Novosphingobium sp. 9U]|uniref:arsinothricin resistance N-acetyltransferase ArsN1 family B n=1 Tax=Novosphingobium sp. 9U TaxID=2653158 RepID=UPI0012F219EE|nr:arsinothricin resistance N-acetyltransferase ArsN1 family B [Novosphingobium sp. 9U]VWX54591.1 Phosphinothricin N-acetyltransferase [Novosphingobium sp. 9U]
MTAFLVRSAHVNDAADVRSIYAPIVETTAISFEEVAPSLAEVAARIEATLEHYPYLVAERDGSVVGYAYAGQHRTRAAYRWSVDVSIYVADAAQRSGVGRALYKQLLTELAGMGFHAAFAGIAMPNEASVALHESLGFIPVGLYREVGYKLGTWQDVGWWQRLL